MNRYLPFALFFLVTALPVLAQTEEPIHYKITVPAGADLTLAGTLILPDTTETPVPVVLLIAGSGPTDRDGNSGYGLKSNAYTMLADSLVHKGIAVARYDKRFSGTNLPTAVNVLKPEEHRFDFFVSDTVGFIRQLQAEKRFSRVIVAGHSEGSLVGMLAAQLTKANGFISLAGAGQNIAEVMKEQIRRSTADTLSKQASVILDSLKAGYTVQRVNPFLQPLFKPKNQPGLISWMKYEPTQAIKNYQGPVLIVNGINDLQVPVSEAGLLKRARPDARLVLIDQMNHIMKNAPADRMENLKMYTNPLAPLSPELATAIAQFVKQGM